MHVEAGREADAFRVVELARARGLLDLIAGGRPMVRSLTAEEQIRERRLTQALVSITAQIRSESSRPSPSRDRLRALDAELTRARLAREAFTTEIYSAHPDLQFGRGDAPVVALAETAPLLGPGTAIIEFVVESSRVWAYVLRLRQGVAAVTAVRLPVAAPELGRQALAFANQVASRDLSFGKLAATLYASLIGSLDPHLDGASHLVLVPDGPLWRVPFQALRSPRGAFLIEDRSVSYAPSVSALHQLVSRRARRAAESPLLVAFGDPAQAAGDSRVRRAARLPEAAREVRAIGDLFGTDRSAVLTDRDATETRLRELAPRASVLHVATHGVLDDTSPMYSYLALTPVDGSFEADDGRLEAWEVMGMTLRANLAVLSACATARGEIGVGEGVIGLTWSLFAAGATTAAVSLWEVDSAGTTAQMIEFHSQMAKGAGVSQAMRHASLAHIRTPQYRHPFYWAAFSIVGAH
jgi:CHAT domain-containing protein